MAFLNLNMNFSVGYTFVSNQFIDNYMLDAHPTFSLIYIYLLRKCFDEGNNIDVKEISKKFTILESDIINALDYWKNTNLIEFENIGDDINISFLKVPEKIKIEATSPKKKLNSIILQQSQIIL